MRFPAERDLGGIPGMPAGSVPRSHEPAGTPSIAARTPAGQRQPDTASHVIAARTPARNPRGKIEGTQQPAMHTGTGTQDADRSPTGQPPSDDPSSLAQQLHQEQSHSILPDNPAARVEPIHHSPAENQPHEKHTRTDRHYRVQGELEQQHDSDPLPPTPIQDSAFERLMSWGLSEEDIQRLQDMASSFRYDLVPQRAQRIAENGGIVQTAEDKETVVLPELANYGDRMDGACHEIDVQFRKLLFDTGYLQEINQKLTEQGRAPLLAVSISGHSRTHFNQQDANHLYTGLLPETEDSSNLVVVDAAFQEISNIDSNGYYGHTINFIYDGDTEDHYTAKPILLGEYTETPDTVTWDIKGHTVLGKSSDGELAYLLSFLKEDATSKIRPVIQVMYSDNNVGTSIPTGFVRNNGEVLIARGDLLNAQQTAEVHSILQALDGMTFVQDNRKAEEEIAKVTTVEFRSPQPIQTTEPAADQPTTATTDSPAVEGEASELQRIIDRHPDWPPILIKFYYSAHTTAEDVQGMTQHIHDADIYLYEGTNSGDEGTSTGAARLTNFLQQLANADPKLLPPNYLDNKIGNAKTDDFTLQGSAFDTEMRAIFGSGIIIGHMDTTDDATNIQLGYYFSEQFENVDFDTRLQLIRNNLFSLATLQNKRQEGKITRFEEEMTRIFSKNPELKNVKNRPVVVLVTRGTVHSGFLDDKFEEQGIQTQAFFPEESGNMMGSYSSCRRQLMGGKEPSREDLARAELDLELRAAIYQNLDKVTNGNILMAYLTLVTEQYNIDEVRDFYNMIHQPNAPREAIIDGFLASKGLGRLPTTNEELQFYTEELKQKADLQRYADELPDVLGKFSDGQNAHPKYEVKADGRLVVGKGQFQRITDVTALDTETAEEKDTYRAINQRIIDRVRNIKPGIKKVFAPCNGAETTGLNAEHTIAIDMLPIGTPDQIDALYNNQYARAMYVTNKLGLGYSWSGMTNEIGYMGAALQWDIEDIQGGKVESITYLDTNGNPVERGLLDKRGTPPAGIKIAYTAPDGKRRIHEQYQSAIDNMPEHIRTQISQKEFDALYLRATDQLVTRSSHASIYHSYVAGVKPGGVVVSDQDIRDLTYEFTDAFSARYPIMLQGNESFGWASPGKPVLNAVNILTVEGESQSTPTEVYEQAKAYKIPLPVYDPDNQITVGPDSDQGHYNDPVLTAIIKERTKAMRALQSGTGIASENMIGRGLVWTVDTLQPEVGNHFFGHGLESVGIQALDELLTHGIRTDKHFNTAPLIHAKDPAFISAMGADMPKIREGIWIVSDYQEEFRGTLKTEDIRYVIVDAGYSKVIDVMRQRWPGVEIIPWHDAPKILTQRANEVTGEAHPYEVLTQENMPDVTPKNLDFPGSQRFASADDPIEQQPMPGEIPPEPGEPIIW